MANRRTQPAPIPLPKAWPKHVQSACLHVISLARAALVAARSQVSDSGSRDNHLRAELAAAHQEISLLREELRLKDLRMARVPSRRRPYYRAVERLAILELRAARGWSRRKTARRFLLGPATIVGWMRRLDRGGERALLETPEPVNRFPDFVRMIVNRLKVLCPLMGKKRIAETLARAGLALSVSTVGRMLAEKNGNGNEPVENSSALESSTNDAKSGNPIRARSPNEVWQIDLTVVPTAAGLWSAWFPFALPPVFPFSWWVAVVVDQYSRRMLDVAVFRKEPTSIQIRRFLGRIAATVGTTPKFLVSDKGTQFDCADYRRWSRRRGIRVRYASTGSLRATAVVERFIRSLKDEWLRRITIPMRRETLRREILVYGRWFETHRPHQSLGGRTPLEVVRGETDERTPFSLKQPIELIVHDFEGRRELPIVELKQAA